MLSNHLILCYLLLLLPSVFPSIRVFSYELAFLIRWPKYWSFSFSISPSNQYSELIFFRIDWFELLAVPGTLKSLLHHHNLEASVFQCSIFFIVRNFFKWKEQSFERDIESYCNPFLESIIYSGFRIRSNNSFEYCVLGFLGHWIRPTSLPKYSPPPFFIGIFENVSYIYLFLTALGLHCCTWAFSSCWEQRLLSSCKVLGFFCCRSWASVVVVHGLSCPVACGIFSDQGSNLCPLRWQADS